MFDERCYRRWLAILVSGIYRQQMAALVREEHFEAPSAAPVSARLLGMGRLARRRHPPSYLRARRGTRFRGRGWQRAAGRWLDSLELDYNGHLWCLCRGGHLPDDRVRNELELGRFSRLGLAVSRFARENGFVACGVG